MIELKSVGYKYRISPEEDILAMDNINLQIREGEYIAIIGSNGSGKSTLARLLNSLLIPHSGEILIDELSSKNKNARSQMGFKVGMVFQNPDNQIISTTAEREIAFGLENLNLSYEQMRPRVEIALKDFDLEDYRLFPPHKLSGGEKQRLALASVLVMQPKYLVLDEPTSLLDARGRRDLLGLLDKLHNQGMTLIHITQFPEEAALAQRLIVLSQGQIIFDDAPEQIFCRVKELEKIGLQSPLLYKMANLLNCEKKCSTDEIVEKIVLKIDTGKIGEKKETKENIIQVENLSFSYAQTKLSHKKVLDDISFEIQTGDALGIIGHTGSGKSTLAQHLNGLLKPLQGRIFFRGENINSQEADLKKIRQKIALSFQFPEMQLFEETVYEDIAFGPKNLGLDKNQTEKRVKDAMRIFDLVFDSLVLRSPFSLSGGEQRMAALAGVLALGPEVLILDEPFAGLDPENSQNLKSAIKKLHQEGITVILISHNLDLIAQLCDKVLLLDKGKMITCLSKEEFFQNKKILQEFDLDIPPVIELAYKLEEKGIDFNRSLEVLKELAEKS